MLTCPEPAENPVLWPWGTRREEDGQLSFAGQKVTDLAQNFATPSYLFDLDDFAARAETISSAMAEEFWEGYGFSGASVYYAGKAFLCTALGEAITRAGMGIDTASLGELTVALNPAMGADPKKIGLHGNNKSFESLRLALRRGIGRIIVDSLGEIDLLQSLCESENTTAPVMVRLTTGVHAGGHSFIATAHEDQKFGLSLASGAALQAVKKIIAAPNLKLVGLHSHIGSQIKDLASFQVAAERLLAFRGQVQKLGEAVPEVDLGGGLAISYQGEDVPSASEYARSLAASVKKACEQAGTDIPHISIEPGRWLAGPVCVSLYQVGTVKDVQLEDGAIRKYVSVDGGMSDNIRPALYDAGYVATLASRLSDAPAASCRIVGMHCESGDILVPEIALPADIQAGDLLVIPATGAYGRAMASNYNLVPRPGVVGLSRKAAPRYIVARETVDDLLRLDTGAAGLSQ